MTNILTIKMRLSTGGKEKNYRTVKNLGAGAFFVVFLGLIKEITNKM